MTLLPLGVKVHLAFGYIDMRQRIDGLAMLVQGVPQRDPFPGQSIRFRTEFFSKLLGQVKAFWALHGSRFKALSAAGGSARPILARCGLDPGQSDTSKAPSK